MQRSLGIFLASAALIAALTALPALAGVAPPGGARFFFNSAPRSIPDEDEGGGVLSKITLRSRDRIRDIDVGVRIDHTAAEDLNVYLVSPQGKFVQLTTDNGGNGNDYGTGGNNCRGGFTVFNDESGTSVRNANAPFAGAFRPETALGAVDGTRMRGTWRLQVFDDDTGNTGTLGCFALRIKTGD